MFFCLIDVSKCFIDVFLANEMKRNSNKTYENKKNRVIKGQTVDLNTIRGLQEMRFPLLCSASEGWQSGRMHRS